MFSAGSEIVTGRIYRNNNNDRNRLYMKVSGRHHSLVIYLIYACY
jgi:hypothetical protein